MGYQCCNGLVCFSDKQPFMKMKYLSAVALVVASLNQAAAANFVTNTGSLTATGGADSAKFVGFTLDTSVTATQLGVYVGTGSLTDTVSVTLWEGGAGGLFNSSNGAIVTLSIGPGDGAADGDGYIYKAIPGGQLLTGGDASTRVAYAIKVTGRSVNGIGDVATGDAQPSYSNFTTPELQDLRRTGGVYGGTGNPYEGGFGAGFALNSSNNDHNLNIASFSTTPTPVPEPETYAMLAGLGLVGFGLYRRGRT